MYQFILGVSAGAAAAAFIIKGKSVLPGVHGESLTPPRKRVYSHLLANVHGPDKLRKMADLFGKEGHSKEAKVLQAKAKQVDAQAMIAEDWAKRARAGDQNAMASIAECRKQAQAGSERAKVSCWLINRWIDQHPMPELHGDIESATSDMGADEMGADDMGADEMGADDIEAHGEAVEHIEVAGAFDAGVEPPPEAPPSESPSH